MLLCLHVSLTLCRPNPVADSVVITPPCMSATAAALAGVCAGAAKVQSVFRGLVLPSGPSPDAEFWKAVGVGRRQPEAPEYVSCIYLRCTNPSNPCLSPMCSPPHHARQRSKSGRGGGQPPPPQIGGRFLRFAPIWCPDLLDSWPC